MSAPDFINNFEASMAKLANIRRGIQSNIEMKEQFSNNIKNSLAQINTRLKDLAGQISALKQQADDLQMQVNTNTASVGDKDRQLQELQSRMQQLQSDHDEALKQLNSEKQQLADAANQKQQQIDEMENQLREITGLKDNLTSERDALRNELQGKGDQAQQHADQIKMLSEESQTKLKEQEEQLLTRINDCEQKIQAFEQQIKDRDDEIARLNQELQNSQGQAATASQELQKQIEQLTQQNGELVQRIVQATVAINEAADELDAISKGVPNAQTQDEVNALLQQIEESLENIGRAIQGQRAAAPVSQGMLAENSPISVVDATSGQRVDMPLNALKRELQRKAVQLRNSNPNIENKYQIALDKINQSTSQQEITNILRGIAIKNTQRGLEVSGGRRTKKIRKQKGGFTYKSTSKRRSISSTPKSNRRTSRRSSR